MKWVCGDRHRRERLHRYNPEVCSLMQIANSSGRLCRGGSDGLGGSGGGGPALEDFSRVVHRYAATNLAVVDVSVLPLTTVVTVEEAYPTPEFVFRLCLILVVFLGLSTLSLPELLVQCVSAACGGRRARRVISEEEEEEDGNVTPVSPVSGE